MTLEQWERVQRAIAGRFNNRRRPGTRRDEFPLTGHLECAVCGSAMTTLVGARSRFTGQVRYYYRCWKRYNGDHTQRCTHGVNHRAPELHARVKADLERIVLSDESLDAVLIVPQPTRLNLQADRDRLQKRLSNALRLRADGEIDRSELEVIRAEVGSALSVIAAREAASVTPAPRPDLSSVRERVADALSSLPLAEVVEALSVTVRIAPDGALTYSLEL